MSDKNKYPVLELLPELNFIFNEQNIVILQAPPGAGKSTVLPLELIKSAWMEGKKIIMLQPRRLATKSVAVRMASLIGEEIGKRIGYRIRFEKQVSEETKIEVVTEGILTRMLQEDPSLENVGLVIFDEFHERSIHADLAFVLAREVQQYLRPDLKLLIMSATINNDLIVQLKNVRVLKSEGREFPVSIEYLGQENHDHISKKVVKAVLRILPATKGDILVFLPGTGEILKTTELINELHLEEVKVFPLYGDLPFNKQQEALLPNTEGKRKIVLTTSIAETSLTIEGISTVIDSGLARVSKYNTKTGLTKLETVAVSKDAAEQRAGRAGRLGPGKCFRLWSEKEHMFLESQRQPEILNSDLAPLLLELFRWGTNDVLKLSWITIPPQKAINNATLLLESLEAIEGNHITKKGKELSLLPAHPRIGHLLLEGKENNLSALAIDIAALLEERDPLSKGGGADLRIRIEALRKFRISKHSAGSADGFTKIEKTAAYWRKLFKVGMDNGNINDYDTGKLIFAAYPERLAVQKEKDVQRYRLGNGKIAKLEEGDSLQHEKWLAIAHLDEGTKEGKIFLAAPVDIKDLEHFSSHEKKIEWNKERGILLIQNIKKIGEVIVHTSINEEANPEEKVLALLEAVRVEGQGVFNWDNETLNFINRVESIKLWLPQEPIPSISIPELMNNLENWLPPYISHIKKREDFFKLNMLEILKSFFKWEFLKRIDELAPETIKVPSGSLIEIKYFKDGSTPVLAVRLQELFGLMETPSVNGGLKKVMIHLLSPGYKPVQVTQDLKSFWTNAYVEVRKELRSRYPKHYWPDNPLIAEPVKGVKKKLNL